MVVAGVVGFVVKKTVVRSGDTETAKVAAAVVLEVVAMAVVAILVAQERPK
jgi:hypothetical protein